MHLPLLCNTSVIIVIIREIGASNVVRPYPEFTMTCSKFYRGHVTNLPLTSKIRLCMTATFHAIRVIKRFECCFHIFSISDFNLANNLLVSTSRTDFTHRLINYFVSLIIVNNCHNYYSARNMSP